MNDRLKETFDKIHAEEDLKEKTKEFLARNMNHNKSLQKYFHRYKVPVMACVLFLLVGIIGYQSYFTETSIISIDINPSLGLNVNRFDKVISIRHYNEDGKKLAKSVNVQFMDYQNAVYEIVHTKNVVSYLDKEEILFISVTGQDKQKSQKMMAQIETCMPDRQHMRCSVSNYEEVSNAHTAGLSCGKYQAFLELQKVRPDIEIEDIKGLSMCQIRELTEDPSKEVPSGKEKGCDGNGHKHRHRRKIQ